MIATASACARVEKLPLVGAHHAERRNPLAGRVEYGHLVVAAVDNVDLPALADSNVGRQRQAFQFEHGDRRRGRHAIGTG